MKLCQKCLNQIRETLPALDRNLALDYEVTTETDCEFWAHRELNKGDLVKIVRRRLGLDSEVKDPLDALRERGGERLQDSTIITDLTPQEQAAKLKHERERVNPR